MRYATYIEAMAKQRKWARAAYWTFVVFVLAAICEFVSRVTENANAHVVMGGLASNLLMLHLLVDRAAMRRERDALRALAGVK